MTAQRSQTEERRFELDVSKMFGCFTVRRVVVDDGSSYCMDCATSRLTAAQLHRSQVRFIHAALNERASLEPSPWYNGPVHCSVCENRMVEVVGAGDCDECTRSIYKLFAKAINDGDVDLVATSSV
ncbi:hypothetical protein [Alphabaculovirus myunipunctae]|uniref:Uncharacterized protein n=1 Tax=Mythimna unipuncta nucleopolyhedrovirus TaxID=447897 RepID=A0A2K9VSA7_9ABAC|nr:hypothetical protein [Mythimna unipuncta nucleopolyhedrovirus]AUV65326.1 hypothetical protein [Mythimna unipuncta nucleopolyhedrovirus]